MGQGRGLMHKDRFEFNMDTEVALGALALYGWEGAVDYLRNEHGIETTVEKLEIHHRRFPEKYEEIREKLAPKLEAMAVNDIRSNIVKSNAVISLAIERAHEALREGRRADPEKVGREIAEIQSKGKDTMMALQGRPTVVKEVRNVDEILRALKAISPDLVIEDAEEVNDLPRLGEPEDKE